MRTTDINSPDLGNMCSFTASNILPRNRSGYTIIAMALYVPRENLSCSYVTLLMLHPIGASQVDFDLATGARVCSKLNILESLSDSCRYYDG